MNIVYRRKLNQKIAFIGLGKLGMPCAEAIANKDYDVTGYDTSKKTSLIVDIKDNIEEAIKDRDIVFIAVPTPHEEGYDGRQPSSYKTPKDFDYSILIDVVKKCKKFMNKNQTVAIISTVLPGTIRKKLAQITSNLNLIYNPYLIAMGTVDWDMLNPEMIIIGNKDGNVDDPQTKYLIDFYSSICDNNPRIELGTWEEAESIKIFYNTFISNKLALVNMIQDVSCKLKNMNVDKVTSALAKCTQRIISSSYMKSGMGDGGACHPRDNIALRWLAKELDLGYDIFGTIISAREKQAENMAKEILKYGSNIHFTSDTYKPDTDLTDGSYSLLVQHYVIKHGGTIGTGFTKPVDVIVRVHQSDEFTTDNKTVIFDPWRTYVPDNPNIKVIHYGHTEINQ